MYIMGPLLPLNNYFPKPFPQYKNPEASNNLINRFVITFRNVSIINMKRPDLCFISQMQRFGIILYPSSGKHHFLLLFEIAELSLLSDVGEERADSTLMCMTANAFR